MYRLKHTATRVLAAVSLFHVASLWATGQTTIVSQPTIDTPAIKFSVVSVKENHSDSQKMSFSAPREGDTISYINYPLFYVVIFSNDFHHSDLVSGLPEWTKSARYDIVAKVAPEDVEKYHALPLKQRQAMFQQVLIDRFGLKFHRESKELPALEMTIAKGGPKMKAADPNTPLGLRGKYGQSILLVAQGTIEAESATMPDLAMFLTAVNQGEQIIDKTGLTGKYDFTIKYAQEMEPGSSESEPDSSSAPPNGPPLPTALKEQLGIQLKPGKALLETFVVDHIERASPN